MTKFPDCESCAFHCAESAICDECHDADQWEPADNDDYSMSGNRKVVKMHKRYRALEMEAA